MEEAGLGKRGGRPIDSEPPQSTMCESPREMIFRAVIDGLYEGRFKPGQRITEAELTAAYGVSRGPVREALNRLAAIGIISMTLQRGAHVRVLDKNEAIDILIVIRSLIALAARMAAQRISRPGCAQKLVQALENVRQYSHLNPGPGYARARDDFYVRLAEVSGNAELQRILPNIQIHLIRIQFRSLIRSADSKRHADYNRIVDAVLAGQPAAAEAAAKAHLDRGIRLLQLAYRTTGTL